MLVEYFDADWRLLFGEAVDFDGLQWTGVGSVSHCHMHAGRQYANVFYMVSVVCI